MMNKRKATRLLKIKQLEKACPVVEAYVPSSRGCKVKRKVKAYKVPGSSLYDKHQKLLKATREMTSCKHDICPEHAMEMVNIFDEDVVWGDLPIGGMSIGGSSVGAIMGVNPWQGPREKYLSLMGEAPQTSIDQCRLMDMGTLLEDTNRKAFEEDRGVKVWTPQSTFIHEEHPYMCAHIDGVFVKEEKRWIWEGKYTTSHLPTTPHVYHVHQVNWYMGICKIYNACISYIDPRGARTGFNIQLKPALFMEQVKEAKAFWEDHVQKKVLPALMEGTNSSDEKMLKHQFPADNGETLEESEEMEALLTKYNELSSSLTKNLEIKHLENKIREFLGEKTIYISPQFGKLTNKKSKPGVKMKSLAKVRELMTPNDLEKFTEPTTGTRSLRGLPK